MTPVVTDQIDDDNRMRHEKFLVHCTSVPPVTILAEIKSDEQPLFLPLVTIYEVVISWILMTWSRPFSLIPWPHTHRGN
jgi:hypothetical protein